MGTSKRSAATAFLLNEAQAVHVNCQLSTVLLIHLGIMWGLMQNILKECTDSNKGKKQRLFWNYSVIASAPFCLHTIHLTEKWIHYTKLWRCGLHSRWE